MKVLAVLSGSWSNPKFIKSKTKPFKVCKLTATFFTKDESFQSLFQLNFKFLSSLQFPAVISRKDEFYRLRLPTRRSWRRRHRTRLGPHLEVKTCDRIRLKTIIRLSCRGYKSDDGFQPKAVSGFYLQVRCCRLQDLLVLQGNTKSTRNKSQEWGYQYFSKYLGSHEIRPIHSAPSLGQSITSLCGSNLLPIYR